MTKRCIFVFFLVLMSALSLTAQEVSAKPTNVCIAKIRNQASSKFDVAQLRQFLVEKLQSTKLAKDKVVNFLTIEAEDSDTSANDVEKAGCEIAVYSRILRKPHEDRPRPSETGTIMILSKVDKSVGEIYGLQCTVERTANGMPLLIDRQFDTQPSTGDPAVLKLLTAESARIEEALAKKLVPKQSP